MLEFRSSLYNIYIDLKEDKSKGLIINGYSGEFVHLENDIIDFLKRHKRNIFFTFNDLYSLDLTEEEIKILQRKGIITVKPVEVEKEHYKNVVKNRHEVFKRKPIEYVFLLSYDCNFNCAYCFQNPFKAKLGRENTKKRISVEQVDNIIKSISTIEKIKQTENPKDLSREVIFYGGEPLLNKNKNIIGYVIDEFNKLGKVDFSAISNGYELNNMMDFLGNNKIQSIQITLDGFEEVHNSRRNIENKSNDSFSRICDNISKALTKDVNINLRFNLDKTNFSSIDSLMNEIEKRGWHLFDKFSISLAPVYFSKKEGSLNNTYNMYTLYLEIIKLKNKHKDREVYKKLRFYEESYFEKFSVCFNENRILLDYFHTCYCSGPTNMFVFDPFDDVYGCLERGATPGEAIAKINSNGEFQFSEEYRNRWENRNIASNEICSNCAYSFFCGGGCATKAEDRNGTIYSNFCNGFKEFFNHKVAEVYENQEKYLESAKMI